ncbi:unnamed protein product [Chondrus crispus]|uniref:Uncharacterized protein n=1 Tax=Chondrus crispus TaxID=2769 RepID=R7QH77_CHOCR|nr:unnamed protein product [Chondrus crispus]CDF36821.1 unnamed protein product [Chondrus crispus]|eukprot:XP_005716640.1 unnamed protein product [Chondrus crispus]
MAKFALRRGRFGHWPRRFFVRADTGSAVVDRLFRVAFGCSSYWGRRRSPSSPLFNSASRPRSKGLLSMLNTVLRVDA